MLAHVGWYLWVAKKMTNLEFDLLMVRPIVIVMNCHVFTP